MKRGVGLQQNEHNGSHRLFSFRMSAKEEEEEEDGDGDEAYECAVALTGASPSTRQYTDLASE